MCARPTHHRPASSKHRTHIPIGSPPHPSRYPHPATHENRLVQLDHRRTHPAVAERLEDGTLHLHGWVYHLSTGEVFAYDIAQDEFLPIASKPVLAAGPPPQATRPI